MNDEVERDEFSVYVFAKDETCHRVLSFVSAREAVRSARRLTHMSHTGQIAQITITDGGDHTVFLWRFGEGVVFPPPEATR
jgi:hypothetical protein